jgi:hypothetical protein
MYVNIFDPENQIGGFFRIGNRANEGYAEMTVCLYLPDGQVGFRFKRAEIADNDAFDAGGMKWEIVTPFEELNVSYRGKVVLLDDPLEMTDPKKAFTENPYSRPTSTSRSRGRVAHRCSAASPTSPTRRRGVREGPLRAARRGSGRIRVGERSGTSRGSASATTPGASLLAGTLVLPLAHCERRSRLRVHGQPGRADADGTRGGFVWEDGKLPTATRSS